MGCTPSRHERHPPFSSSSFSSPPAPPAPRKEDAAEAAAAPAFCDQPASAADHDAATGVLDLASKTREALSGIRNEIERTREKGEAMQRLLPPADPLLPSTAAAAAAEGGRQTPPPLMRRVPPPPPKLERMLRQEGVQADECDEGRRKQQLVDTADALALLLQGSEYARDMHEFTGRAGIVSVLVQMVARAGGEENDARAVWAYVACEAVRAHPPPENNAALRARIKDAELALRAYGTTTART